MGIFCFSRLQTECNQSVQVSVVNSAMFVMPLGILLRTISKESINE